MSNSITESIQIIKLQERREELPQYGTKIKKWVEAPGQNWLNNGPSSFAV